MVLATLLTLAGGLGLLGAALWPAILRDIVIVNLGYGRVLQPISDFPSYQCRKITGPGLQACEDMWLSEKTRHLFLACSKSLSRQQWMPNIQRFNATGRSLEDRIMAMSIDIPRGAGYAYSELVLSGFSGTNGDGELNLVGLTGVDRGDHIELYLVNNRPSLNLTTNQLMDQNLAGANSTIEHFRVGLGKKEMQHLRTFSEPAITTPNNIATRGNGAFYITNDHGPHKIGTWHHLSPFIKGGNVAYCNQGGCRQVASGLGFPNGLSFGPEGLLYVPSSVSGNLKVFKTQPDGGVEEIDKVHIPYPLDNLSLDADGDLWVPGIPDITRTLAAFENPIDSKPPATVFRIRKKESSYEVEKVLEDRDGSVLPGATAVVHDVKTGRIFVSGVYSPFISVCEPRALAGLTYDEL